MNTLTLFREDTPQVDDVTEQALVDISSATSERAVAGHSKKPKRKKPKQRKLLSPNDEYTIRSGEYDYARSLESTKQTGAESLKVPQRVNSFAYDCDDTDCEDDASICIEFGDEINTSLSPSVRRATKPSHSIRSLQGNVNRKQSRLESSIKSFLSIGDNRHFGRNRNRSGGRRSAFATSRDNQHNQNFRVSKNLTEMKAERIEAFFYNHGMEIALGVLYLSLNILMAAHGAYQFTEVGGWTTDDDILRVTLPIARAGGRLVTFNCALLLLTACKYLWTCIRTYVAPILPLGFPIDDIMPKYHRYVALTVIVNGCIVHTLPQIVNYATKSILINHDGMRLWTFGDEFATKQLLMTGTLLTIIFSTFFLTTLKFFRKTATGFRWFWFFHMGGVATAYPLLLLHGTCRGHPIFLYFAMLPLALYMFDITMRRAKIDSTDVLEWNTYEDKGQQITELILECPPNFTYTPGQYAELKFTPISTSEWHPFTIASAPDEQYGGPNGPEKIVFYIKNSGRWTEALFNYASAFDLSKAKKSTEVQIRGPHGAPAMNYFEYKHIVVVGSGVGVTPLLSIWKYLVARGRTMLYYPDRSDKDSLKSTYHGSDNDSTKGDLDSFPYLSTNDHGNGEEGCYSVIRSVCLILENILESMTVSMFLLVLFVLGETLTLVLQIFKYEDWSNLLGSYLSLIALCVHGITVIVSTIALGWSKYVVLLKCWLECAIILVDSFALWFSIMSYRMDNAYFVVVGLNRGFAATAYFVLFGLVIALHAIRIFHIFYVTLKPVSKSVSSTDRSNTDQEICSIDGILINRTYSNMKFAARSLLQPIAEDGLSDLFSMEFYGTREKPSADKCDKDEHALVSDMMGSVGSGIDFRSTLCQNRQHDAYFHAGRPDWNQIFLKAIAKAHQSAHRNCCGNSNNSNSSNNSNNKHSKGESVGVFFCGSPAIAKDMQTAAAEITARHQFAVKQLDGKACRCKLIVHSENF